MHSLKKYKFTVFLNLTTLAYCLVLALLAYSGIIFSNLQVTVKHFKYSNRESNIADKLINRGEEAAPELYTMSLLNK